MSNTQSRRVKQHTVVRVWIYLWPLFRQDQLPIKGRQIVLFRKGHQIR